MEGFQVLAAPVAMGKHLESFLSIYTRNPPESS